MEIGKKFPYFALPNQSGKIVKSADFEGKWLVLYLYPKDDTKNCTIQAKAFTANKQAFEKANIVVLGISPDDVDSHKSFCDKFTLAVDLLADPSCAYLNTLGVGQSEWQGTKYWDRTTFVINPDGILVKRYDKVNAEGHDEVLLQDIEQLKSQAVAH